MTDFCPKCGKKAENGEKICSVCGEEMTSLSDGFENCKKDNRGNKINLFEKTIGTVLIILIICVVGGLGFRYFSAGKNIENTANTQKSELKILKRPSSKQYEKSEEDNIVRKVETSEEDTNIKEDTQDSKSFVLDKKYKYLKIMSRLDKEVQESADKELNGDQEKLLNYTSGIYKKYDTVLNMIYGDIVAALEGEDLEILKQDELDWIKKKDAMASSAVGSDDTSESDENWAYFDSLATSTKDRCYYLIHKYME